METSSSMRSLGPCRSASKRMWSRGHGTVHTPSPASWLRHVSGHHQRFGNHRFVTRTSDSHEEERRVATQRFALHREHALVTATQCEPLYDERQTGHPVASISRLEAVVPLPRGSTPSH